MELGNLLRATFGAHVVLGAYSRINAQDNPPERRDEEPQAIVQYLLSGRVAQNWQNESYANEAISVVLMFADEVSIIRDKYARMLELAEEANKGNKSSKKLEQMQEELEQLAQDINDIVNSAEYNGNKLFTKEGTTISIYIGNNSSIDVVAKDLSIDAASFDLTTDPDRALAIIQWKASDSDYYSEYLADQVGHLQGAIELIELDRYNDLGMTPEEFNADTAKQVAAYAAIKTSEQLSALFDAQANVDPDRALELLKDKIGSTTE